MTDSKRYCMGCMKTLEDNAIICPHCHYSTGLNNKPSCLNQGTVIDDRYLIGKVLATANDSIIYIGLNKETEQPVTVYEFFPHKITVRDDIAGVLVSDESKKALFDSGLQSFLSLWRGIKMFDDIKCIPRIREIFTDNGTAYAIAEHKDTVALKDYFAKTKRPLPVNRASAAFLPLLNALKLLHNAGIIHGNITPSTIQVDSDGRLNLIGFSIPQCRSDIPEFASKPVSGFSALEIYLGNSARAQSDIYSIMAVMYYSVTGIVIPRATERVNNSKISVPASIARTIPASLMEAFSRSLAVQPNNRLNKMDELIALLKSSATQKAPQKAATATGTKESSSNGETVAFSPLNQNSTDTNEQKAVPKKPVVPAQKQINQEPEESEKEAANIRQKDLPLPVLGVLTCLAVVIICFILFVVLYATVLFKNVSVPALDEALAPYTFLPINKDVEDDGTHIPDFNKDESTTANTAVSITVPDFTKQTEDSIVSNELWQKNFDILFRRESSETVVSGAVIKQSVAPGSSVMTGTEIIIWISTGKPEITVPDVYNKDYEAAKKELEDIGFKVSKDLVENTDGREPGTVSNMSIEPGKAAAKGTEIILYVYDEIILTVPNVYDKAFEAAEKELTDLGLTVKKEIVENPEKKTANTVADMSITPGTTVSLGDTIILYVYDVPVDETTEPLTEPSTEPTSEPATEPSTDPDETTENAAEETKASAENVE